MCMMSFIELQKISELSFECMFGLLCNVSCCTKRLRRQKLTCRFRLSMGHFCWAAGKIFTQHKTSCKFEDHRSFGSKFNVPVGFLSLRT